jgi:hypothetical protein
MLSGIHSGGTNAMQAPKRHRRFEKMDANGDGGLDESELSGMAKRSGKSAADILKRLDTSGDGKVDAQEMDAGRPKHNREGGNPDGSIASQFTTSLMNLLKQLRDSGSDAESGQGADEGCDIQAPGQAEGVSADHAELFSKLDADGNGSLSQAEFSAMGNHGPDLKQAASEFTTALLNIMKQLQGPDQNGMGGSAAKGTQAQAVSV